MEAVQVKTKTVIVGWVVTLAVSSLPDAIWRSFGGEFPSWVLWAKIGLLLFLTILTFAHRVLQPLRLYLLMLLILVPASQWLAVWLPALTVWKKWFNSAEWIGGTAVIQLVKMGVAFLMLTILLLLGKSRRSFFLTTGQLQATTGKIPWLGIKKPVSWARVGPLIAVFPFAPVLAVLWLGAMPSREVLSQAILYLPACILFAAMNGFSEEMSFRASVLSTLENAVGGRQALAISSVFFGLAHFGGTVSAGIIWVIFAGFLGWLMGKSMLETRGIFWAWLIHFVEDIPIYFFMAIAFLR